VTAEEAFPHIDPELDRQFRNGPDKWHQRMINRLEAPVLRADLYLFCRWSDGQGETQVQPAAWFSNTCASTRLPRFAGRGIRVP